MTAKKWIVYSLADNRSSHDIRYIGITSKPNRRFKQHKSCLTNTHRENWIRSVIRDGADIIMREIYTGLDAETAKRAEVELIAKFKADGYRLTNSTIGGDGVVGKTPEVRAKIAARSKANATPEVVARLQEVLKRPDVIERKIAAIKASMTPSVRKKIGDVHRGKVLSTDTRRKISITNSGKRLSAQEHERLIIAQRRSGPRSDNTSGFRGVSFDKRRQKWAAYINVENKRTVIGRFATKEEAASARDKAAVDKYGRDCFVNMPAMSVQA